MKKYGYLLFTALCMLLMSSVTAAERRENVSKEIEVSGYNSIIVSSCVDIILTNEPKGVVRVEACPSMIEDVRVSSDGKMLYVSYSGNNAKGKINVYVPAEGVSELCASGGADISSLVKISVPELRIRLSGASDLEAEVDCERVNIGVSGASDVRLSGTAECLNISASGAADIHCEGLIAKKVNCGASGSSDIYVYANEEIRGRLSGASDLRCEGSAEIFEVSKSGSAHVSRR